MTARLSDAQRLTIREHAARLQFAKKQKREAEDVIEDSTNKLAPIFLEAGIKRSDGVVFVTPETTTYNEDKLRKSIGAERWRQVTKRVLDKKLLEAAIAAGKIDPMKVAAASEVVPTKPYFKVS